MQADLDRAQRPAPQTPPQRPAQPGLGDELHRLVADLRGAIGERVELLSLELSAASRAAAQLALLVATAAIVAVTAWIGLWAVVAGLLIRAGMHWALALLVVIGLNLLVALFALVRARALLPRLSLPATRRHLSFAEAPAAARAPAAPQASATASVQPQP
jgi:uncharacterized membrane protein YqjE